MHTHGLVGCYIRPLTMRNLMGFLHRLCGTDLMAAAPWTLSSLLERYRDLKIACRTPATLHAHAHWINLLRRCPGMGAQEEDLVCTPAMLQPLLQKPIQTGRHPRSALLARHSFSEEEVLRLHRAAIASGPMDRLLLLLHPGTGRGGPLPHSRQIFTTGLRVGGLSHMPLVRSTDAWCVDGVETNGMKKNIPSPAL